MRLIISPCVLSHRPHENLHRRFCSAHPVSAPLPSGLIDKSRIAVVVPALDESASIAAVIGLIRKEGIARIIVVDDGSSDGTDQVARQAGATVLPLPTRLGAWGATQAGLRYALANDSDIVVTMDADGQHPASAIHALVEPIVRGDADFVIGSCTDRGSSLRHLAWWILKHVSGLHHADITSGLRAYNRSTLITLSASVASTLQYQDVGVLVLLKKYRFTSAEVPVQMAQRAEGSSKIFETWRKVIYYMAYSVLLGLSKRGSRPPLTKTSQPSLGKKP